jgi:hypothetical protein
MSTAELARAIAAEPEGTDRWITLCLEAWGRVRRKAMSARYIPDSFDPAMRPTPPARRPALASRSPEAVPLERDHRRPIAS